MIQLVRDQLWDWRLGVRTLATTPSPGGGARPGQPASYAVLRAAAQSLGPTDVVYDIGCGAGRACAVFARTGARVIGVELSPVATRAARRNGVTVIEADARAIDYPDVTALWIFNPFGAQALRAVLRRAQAPRVLYHYASESHQEVLLAEGYGMVRRQEVARGEPPILHYRLPGP